MLLEGIRQVVLPQHYVERAKQAENQLQVYLTTNRGGSSGGRIRGPVGEAADHGQHGVNGLHCKIIPDCTPYFIRQH